MICSVVNLLFFMSVLVVDGLYSFNWYGSVGAGHWSHRNLLIADRKKNSFQSHHVVR